jgi:AcrR family transcriptional regulator
MKTLTSKQQEIVRASFDIVRTKGIKGLTTKGLARALRITEPALYRHFKNKTDILYAILCRMEADNRRIRVEFAKTNMPALKKLETMYAATMGMLARHPVLAAVMFSEEHYQENKKLKAKVLDIQNGTLETICRTLTEGMKTNQIRDDIPEKDVGLMIMGTMRLIAIRWRLSGFHSDLIGLVDKSWHSLKMLLAPAR